jgi:hypothetical protein
LANAVENLFDQILPQLDSESSQIIADWPNVPTDDDLKSTLPIDIDGEEVRPYRDEEIEEPVFGSIGRDRPSISPISEDEQAIIEGGIRTRGFDALAFYKSRRNQSKTPFPGKWGIFYLRQGLEKIAWEIAIAYPGYKNPRCPSSYKLEQSPA